jgi:hypothetical protein
MKTVIGLDLGRSALKMVDCWQQGGETRRARVSFPTSVAAARRLVGGEESRAALEDTVVVDGQAFFIGRTATLQAGDSMQGGFNDQWLFTPEHGALIKGALDKAAAAGVPDPADRDDRGHGQPCLRARRAAARRPASGPGAPGDRQRGHGRLPPPGATGVLIAGGGAPLMCPWLSREWKHAVLCEDPRFSVAEGFLRAGLHTV